MSEKLGISWLVYGKQCRPTGLSEAAVTPDRVHPRDSRNTSGPNRSGVNDLETIASWSTTEFT